MIKKMLLFLLACLMVGHMSSCFISGSLYTAQDGIKTNYNNISSYNRFWLTNDSICYIYSSITQGYIMVTENEKITLKQNNGDLFRNIQKYGNKIYMLSESCTTDEDDTIFCLELYDINTKKIIDVCSIKNCDNFLVLEETIYYLEYKWEEEGKKLSLKKYSTDLKEHAMIESSVLSFGVIDNNIFYVVEKNNEIIIYEYDAQTELSIKRGSFGAEKIKYKDLSQNINVSYTADCLLFYMIDYENETSMISKYSFQNDTLTSESIAGYLDCFISCDEFSYFIVSYAQSDYSKIFKLDNITNNAVQIAQISGEGSLFVGSDDGVYVLEHESNILRYYSEKCDSQTVYKF